MLTPKQIKVFEAFVRYPYKELTYREIKEHSNEKSNSIIQKAITQFLAEYLVKKREVGNIILYTVNLNNTLVFSYFNIIIKEKMPKQVKRSLEIIQEEMINIEFKSTVIFGSYAEGKSKEKSDLDVAVLVNSSDDKRNCELKMKSAELKTPLKIDYHIITKDELLQMLKDSRENLGKQIAKKHLAMHNPAIFYEILQEGMNNGFKIIY